jgi:superfamily II DNA or RNA helicase
MKWPEMVNVTVEWRVEFAGFVLRAVDQGEREIPSAFLRKYLFAWHQDSYFGSLVGETVIDRKHVLVLPALYAIDYFEQRAPMQHIAIQWPKQVDELQTYAREIRSVLANGHFEPVLALDRKDGFGWQATQLSVGLDRVMLNAWLQAAMEQLLAEPGEIREVWQRLGQEKPLLVMGKRANQGFAGDEDRWLETIGFRQDEVPFSVALKLVEPDGGSSSTWQVQPVLLDRETGAIVEQADAPEAWSADMPERLARAEAAWRNVWPGFAHDLDDERAWQFIETEAMRLRAIGVTVLMPSWWESLLTKQPRLIADVRAQESSGLFGMQQLMDYDWRIAIGDMELSEAQFHDLMQSGKRMAKVNGQWIALQPKWVQSLQKAMQKQDEHGKVMSLSEVLALHLAGGQDLADVGGMLGDEQSDVQQRLKLEVRIQKQLHQWTTQMMNQAATEPFMVPAMFEGTLRAYQLEGAGWLGFLRQSGLGACLADDMGLGKTVQFIAHICQLKASGQLQQPVLLICPTSVLGNWQQEWKRFAPQIRTYLHYGSQRLSGKKVQAEFDATDVVITSYSLALLDNKDLLSMRWSTICLDEAQNIKNPQGKQSQAIRKLQAEHRVALTGTPIENRLLELWSIFDFLNPGYLGSMRAFHRSFVKPIERKREDAVLQKLQRLVRPFLLRRTKRDEHIQLDLPDKLEREIYVSLTAEQAAMYEQQLEQLMSGIDGLTAMERRGQILAVLTKLKQICDHPGLLEQHLPASPDDDWVQKSNKLSRLVAMVDEVLAENQRCIIFTQYVRMGRTIESILQQRLGRAVSFLHGGLGKEERDRMVARFQSSDGEDALQVLILSLKAGGIGLNLTAATHVFHFDRWWNPAVENQATDRAYRIGQSKQVQVHKFVALGTLEERIHEMIERKKALSEHIVGAGESWITEMSTDEIRALFRLRRDWLVEEET